MATLPTVRVRRKDDDHEVTINLSRYQSDPGAYELLVDARGNPVEGSAPAGEADDFLSGTVADAAETIAGIEHVEGLDDIEARERAGKARKGVLSAIEARRAELEA